MSRRKMCVFVAMRRGDATFNLAFLLRVTTAVGSRWTIGRKGHSGTVPREGHAGQYEQHTIGVTDDCRTSRKFRFSKPRIV